MNATSYQAAGLARRLASISYDLLLLIALWFAATLPVLVVRGGDALPPNHIGFQIYILLITTLYFASFWHFGGQTAGMRAWRVRVVGNDSTRVSWAQALARAALGALSWICLGMGFWWSALGASKAAWHDTYSGTRLVIVPTEPRGPKS
ncbi:MAG: RDD family protein [Gammaproteobacteria bacterium]|nr:RDD family protein [Gammaproteobacteria bacterium]